MEQKNLTKAEEILFENISRLIEESRNNVAKAINTAMVYTYYGVGQYIVEFEQGGNVRAEYGKGVLKRLSAKLTDKYGDGWSEETLRKSRQLFFTYGKKVTSGYQIENANQWLPNFTLSWSHYIILMGVENPQARSFYEIEATKEQWSKRYLQRQVASSLYERIALSRNKDEVMRLANEGQTLEKPSDIIKNPLVLEFIGLKPEAAYSENKLETAILDKIEEFLMECGKGFLFESRQKRFTFDEDNFYVDLVLYNRILQCYVLVDLKVDKLSHQDLGQMLMYVNYFDRYKRLEFEKPTIGILLCPKKNDALVELTLPKDANIYAQQYALCLPDKELLQKKLSEWVEEYEMLNEKEG